MAQLSDSEIRCRYIDDLLTTALRELNEFNAEDSDELAEDYYSWFDDIKWECTNSAFWERGIVGLPGLQFLSSSDLAWSHPYVVSVSVHVLRINIVLVDGYEE